MAARNQATPNKPASNYMRTQDMALVTLTSDLQWRPLDPTHQLTSVVVLDFITFHRLNPGECGNVICKLFDLQQRITR